MTEGHDSVYYTAWKLLLQHCTSRYDIDPLTGFTDHKSMMYWFMRMAEELHRPREEMVDEVAPFTVIDDEPKVKSKRFYYAWKCVENPATNTGKVLGGAKPNGKGPCGKWTVRSTKNKGVGLQSNCKHCDRRKRLSENMYGNIVEFDNKKDADDFALYMNTHTTREISTMLGKHILYDVNAPHGVSTNTKKTIKIFDGKKWVTK